MKKDYQLISKSIQAVTEGEDNLVANLSNIAAILHSELGHWWTGFYLVDTEKNNLVLGPFQGPLACTRIPFGKGVCGSAWELKQTLMVDDVHKFEGHIACSSESNSEIVVPIIVDEKVLAVLDIDSKDFASFDEEDRFGLETIGQLIAKLLK